MADPISVKDSGSSLKEVLLVIGRSGGMVWEITVREVSYPGEAQLSLDMTLSARLFPIPYRRWAQ